MANKIRHMLFIDGTNLYAGQYALFGPTEYLNFAVFMSQLEKKLKLCFDRVYFYCSYTPHPTKVTPKQNKYLINEFLFYKSVRMTPRVEFFKGYRSRKSGKEKEVDVKLAADLVCLAFLDTYDQAYLLTGDADFLQALLLIQKYHPQKKLYTLCLENKIMYKALSLFDHSIIHFTDHKTGKKLQHSHHSDELYLYSQKMTEKVKK